MIKRKLLFGIQKLYFQLTITFFEFANPSMNAAYFQRDVLS